MPSKTANSARATRPRRHVAASPLVITIDGPAGVGKSTAAQLLARRLGLVYLDTGATYRALAYAALKAGLHPIADAHRLPAMARHLPLQLRQASRGGLWVGLAGVDITTAIRTEAVSEAAAQISQYPEVRAAMVELQRSLVSPQGVVVEGRDTGSIVFPHATHKFFLDADPRVRARRRQGELSRLYGSKPPLAQVEEQLRFRDGLDRTRRVGPLVKPAGAATIDTTHRTALQVVRAMLQHITTKPQAAGFPGPPGVSPGRAGSKRGARNAMPRLRREVGAQRSASCSVRPAA